MLPKVTPKNESDRATEKPVTATLQTLVKSSVAATGVK